MELKVHAGGFELLLQFIESRRCEERVFKGEVPQQRHLDLRCIDIFQRRETVPGNRRIRLRDVHSRQHRQSTSHAIPGDSHFFSGCFQVLYRSANVLCRGLSEVQAAHHEMGFASKVAHRVIFMDNGEIVEDASKDDFFGKPRSERAQQFLAKILSH